MPHSSSPDLQRRFAGVARLYGTARYTHISQMHIAVAGIGGVGSWAVETLARTGVGYITLIDLDNIAESNVNRQLHALSSEIGKSKVLAMQQRIEQINPSCHVTQIEDFLTVDNLSTHLPRSSAHPDHASPPILGVIDAIDQLVVKAALIEYCQSNQIPLIVTGAAGGRCNPCCIKIDDLARTEHDRLLAKLRHKLRRTGHFPKEPRRPFKVPCVYSTESVQTTHHGNATPQGGLNCAGYGSVMSVTASFGLFAAGWMINHLIDQGS